MIPTSIDGTDITGATIDGNDVSEITVDGQTVFTALSVNNFPVAYSNLVAWYPFDSATYGGTNADDVTAILGGSGDDTPYNGTVSGATYQSSGGVTDINAGANSGAFDFDGSNDSINVGSNINNICANPYTVMAWVNMDSWEANDFMSILDTFQNGFFLFADDNSNNRSFSFFYDDGPNRDWVVGSPNRNTNEWYHVAARKSGTGVNNQSIFVNGVDDFNFNRESDGAVLTNNNNLFIGSEDGTRRNVDGTIEDVRLYNTALTNQEINQIYQNTKP